MIASIYGPVGRKKGYMYSEPLAITCYKLAPTLVKYDVTYVISHNEYLIFTSPESAIRWVYPLLYVCKSTHFY